MTLTMLMLMPNGLTAAFDESGAQIPVIQGRSWFLLVIEELERSGINPCAVEIRLPHGGLAHPFKTDEGTWNWAVAN